MKVTIFSYGSNMSHQRIRARVPSARFLRAGYLTHHTLRWHKLSKDGSGKCDAFETGVFTDVVWGGLFRITADEKHLLDSAEGLGTGYQEKRVEVSCIHDEADQHKTQTNLQKTTQATLYTAIPINHLVKPYSWYKNFVVSGARQCGLPAPYVAALDAVETAEDPNKKRCSMNEAILRDAWNSDA
ncbi:MAG: gamma-glutamylcyclotransferase family protein [Hyphomicrobiales bacterium]